MSDHPTLKPSDFAIEIVALVDALRGTSKVMALGDAASALGLDPATNARGILSLSSGERRRRGRPNYEWWRYQRSDGSSPDNDTAVPYFKKNGIAFRKYHEGAMPMYQVDMARHGLTVAEIKALLEG